MSKISTKTIKSLIPTWLDTEKLKETLKEYYIQDDSSPDVLRKYGEWFKSQGPHTVESIRETIWSQWKNGDEWKREQKHRLSEEFDSYFYMTQTGCEFAEDFCGGSNQELVNTLSKDEEQLKKCWFREFIPRGSLGDNFRLEVITTPDDDKIVGWIVIVD